MKFCLAFAFQNEDAWLRLHLPAMLDARYIDGVVALDGGSTDGGADYVRSLGGVVHTRSFDWRFADHMNALIAACEAEGYDAMLRIDPDECLFPDDIDAVRAFLSKYRALRLARFNFVGNRLRYAPYNYPDYQTRAFLLNHGVRYTFDVHETLEASFKTLGWVEDGSELGVPRDIMRLPHIAIYHYGGIQNDARFALKHVNYARLQQGLPPLEALPVGYSTAGPARFGVAFGQPQPIGPFIDGGYCAPVEVSK